MYCSISDVNKILAFENVVCKVVFIESVLSVGEFLTRFDTRNVFRKLSIEAIVLLFVNNVYDCLTARAEIYF